MKVNELFEEVKDKLKPMKNYISKKYKEKDIAIIVDEQSIDYIDNDWDKDNEYDNELDWYADYGNGEAEDDVIKQLTNETIKITKTKNLNYEEHLKFKNWLQDKYRQLDY